MYRSVLLSLVLVATGCKVGANSASAANTSNAGNASGTVAGIATRRYHGLLVAALTPCVGRTVLVGGTAEEVVYDGRFEADLIGLLNDESAPVSKVHLGVVFLVDGDSPNIAIRETTKLAGELMTLDEMRIHYLEMESWSQMVFDRLTS